MKAAVQVSYQLLDVGSPGSASTNPVSSSVFCSFC